jgi:DNA-binding CsgD family transcriptional regulator
MPAGALQMDANSHDEKPLLSPREFEILLLSAEGETDAVIARSLGISHTTVRFHLRNACLKLKASNRRHAIYLAFNLGVFERVLNDDAG